MQQRHFNIPIFIPHAACPHKCIFCDQKSISGAVKSPSLQEIRSVIESHLATIPGCSNIEIAFFGGNFTGIPAYIQEQYLQAVSEYISSGNISGIRISTRPDYINNDILLFLKKYNVSAIELGVQSTDGEVLGKSGRGHNAEDIFCAARLIREAGIELGMQMMIGLPGDTYDKSIKTAEAIIALKAVTVRVYPALVIKGTELEEQYNDGKYNPLPLEQAVSWCADILQMFEKNGINVIKMGLHPSEGFLSGELLTAGPFHVSFRELVVSEIWRRLLLDIHKKKESRQLVLHVSPAELNYAVGYHSSNKKMLMEKFKSVKFKPDPLLKGRIYNAECS